MITPEQLDRLRHHLNGLQQIFRELAAKGWNPDATAVAEILIDLSQVERRLSTSAERPR